MKLGSITTIRTGKLDANAASDDGQYPFFTCSQDTLRISTYSYDCECVLVAGNGDLNVKYYNGKFDAYQRTYVIENNFSSDLSIRYLYYFLNRYVHTLRRQSIGGVIKYIKLENLTEADLPLPNISTQNEIVEKLDIISELITKRNQQLAKLDTLVKSRFIEMFGDPVTNPMGWEVKKLRDICVVGSSKRIYQSEQTSTGVPFLRISDLVSKITSQEENCDLHISEEKFSEFKQQGLVPQSGDILVTARGTLGLCYIMKPEDRFYFQDGMISWVHTSEAEINPVYISYLFDSQGIKRQIGSAVAGSTVAYLSIAQLGQFDILLPPIALQNQFADFVQQVNISKSVLQKLLEKQELLRAALMQEYFG